MAGQISESEARSMADSLSITFTSKAAISRPTTVKDDAGGTTQTWADVGTVKCFYYFRGAGGIVEQIQMDRIEATTAWTFLFPRGTDIRNADRLRVIDEEPERTFEVGSVDSPRSLNIVVTIGANEVT
jgi:head-tail adaptor